MHPAALAKAVAAALPADALAVFDGGHTTFWSNDLTPALEVRTRFHEPGMSHLGFGLPYALALQFAHPDRPVVNITGDGSFGFTLQELDTARRSEAAGGHRDPQQRGVGHHPAGPEAQRLRARHRAGGHRLRRDRHAASAATASPSSAPRTSAPAIAARSRPGCRR